MKLTSKLWLLFGLILVFQDLFRIAFKLDFFRYIDEIAFVLIAIIILVIKLVKKDLKTDNLAIFAFAIFIFGVIMELFVTAPRVMSLVYVFYGLKIYFVYLIARNLNISRKEYIKVLDLFGYIFLIFGGIGILNYLAGNTFLQNLGFESYARYGFIRITGLFVHPHPLGWMAAIFSFYLILKYLFIDKSKKNIVFFGLSLLILGLTNNRKSMLGLIIAAGIVYFLFIKKQISPKLNKKIIIGAILLFLFITIFYLNTIMEIFKFTKGEYIESGDTPRSLLYSTGFKIMIDNFPFGSGVATFGTIGSLRPYSDIYEKYGLSNIYGFSSDNPLYINDAFWASIMGEQGFIGLILYLAFLMFIFYKVLVPLRNTENVVAGFFLIFSMFMLIEGTIESIVAPTFFYFLYLYFIFGTIGITLSMLKKTDRITGGKIK